MKSSYTTITVEQQDAVLVVTLNRPDVLNAFDQTMQDELRSVWRDMRSDNSINVGVITGSGDRAFCVGIDRNQPMSVMEGTLFGTSNAFMYDDPGDDLGPKSCDLWNACGVRANEDDQQNAVRRSVAHVAGGLSREDLRRNGSTYGHG